MTDAAWTLVGVIAGSIGTGFFGLLLQQKQFRHNKEMFFLQNKGVEIVKSLITEMLSHKSYTDRSFEAIRPQIGGYSDDEIRQFLHAVGAKRVSRHDGSEWWYLLSRQEERLAMRQPPRANIP